MASLRFFRPRLLAALTLLVCAQGMVARAPAQSPPGPIVARVRVDGLVVPIAVYEKGMWRPVMVDATTGGLEFSLPDEWHFSPFQGTPTVLNAISVVRILDDDVGYDGWGVTTDLASRTRTYNGFPIERVGIATSIPLPVRLFAPVPPDSAAHHRVRARLLLAFDSAAARERSRLPAPHAPLTPVPELKLKLRSLASGDRKTTLYEVAARRRFSAYAGAWELTLYGWAIDDGTRIILLEPRVGVADIDRGSGDHPHAFAAVALDGAMHIVGAVTGYESQDAMIWKWSGTTLLPALPQP